MASERLMQLLQSGWFDPDDSRHYLAFLREWATGDEELRQFIRQMGQMR